jgi:hypothetical protein
MAALLMAAIQGASPSQLLRQIVADPETGELLAELCSLNLGQTSDAQSHRPHGLRLAVGVLWALAAGLAVCLGVWRIADPRRTFSAPTGEIRLLGQAEHQADYWDELTRQRAIARYEQERLRDYALAAACVACLVLSIPVAWWAIRPNKPPPNT